MSPRLKNYLRMYRKRAGFSQQEVAFLLGCHFGAKVSKYETFTREPNLRTALAFKVIFDTELSQLFAGLYEQVARDASKRAKSLVDRLDGKKVGKRKLLLLRSIAKLPREEDLRWEPISRP